MMILLSTPIYNISKELVNTYLNTLLAEGINVILEPYGVKSPDLVSEKRLIVVDESKVALFLMEYAEFITKVII